MLTENQKKIIDTLSKEKETEEFSSMVLFVSDKQIMLTVNDNLSIDFDCDIDVPYQDMMVSLKSFNEILKIMPSPSIYVEGKDVVFKSGEVLIKLPNMFSYNKYLCEGLLQTNFINHIGTLKFSDLTLLNKFVSYDKVLIDHSCIVLKKDDAYYHVPVLSILPDKFVFPKTFLKMLTSYGQDVKISSNHHSIYLNSFSDVRFKFRRCGCYDDTASSINLYELNPVAAFDNITLRSGLYGYLLSFKSVKNITFTFQKDEERCVFFIQDARGQMTSTLATKFPIRKSIKVTVTLIELKRILKQLTEPMVAVNIDEVNKILFIDNIPLSFI